MDLKEQIKTVISETCTHWLISDDAELKKVSKKLSKEFETIINAEIERRQPVSTKNNGLHKHVVSGSALPDHGICMENACQKPATKDYNGHGHWVCDYHHKTLNDYFDEEYD